MAMVRYGGLTIAAADLYMRALATANDHSTMLAEPFDHL